MYADFNLGNNKKKNPKPNYNKNGLAVKLSSDMVREKWVEERAKIKVRSKVTAEFHALHVYIGFYFLLSPLAVMTPSPDRSKQDATDTLAIITFGSPGGSSNGVQGGCGGIFSHHSQP